MKKLINFVTGLCGISIFGGVLTMGLSLSSCSNQTALPISPSTNQTFRAKDIPPDAVTICGGYVVSVSCSGESMCPPVANSGCTIFAIITPPTTPQPTDTPTIAPTVSPSPFTTQSPSQTPATNTPTIPPTDTPTFTDTPTPVPTDTFTPTIPPTPTFTPTPNPRCAQCDSDFFERNSEANQDFQSELLEGAETCNGIFGGLPPPLGPELLEACNAADEGIAFLALSAKLIASAVQHNICLTDNNCP